MMRAIVLGSVLLLASACSGSHWGHDHYASGHNAWHGPQHYPVIVKGVPVETPEVQHAKAAHAAAHAKVAKHDDEHYAPHWDHHAPEQKAWHGPLHYPVIVKGVPVETPEVRHAKAAHATAYAKIARSDEYFQGDHSARSYGSWHDSQHVPVIKNGVPVETPEVQHAKAAHAAAHAKAAKYTPMHGDYYGKSYGSWNDHHHHHVPATKNGYPVETPEVQHAKAAHFAAHAEAKARLYKRSVYTAPMAYVPLDTPEVAAAKVAHFAAHAAVKTGHGPAPAAHWDHYAPEQKAWHGPLHYPVIVKGVPVETPEVQHAKAAHAAAYAKVATSDRVIPIHEDQYARSYGSWHGSQYVPEIKNGVPVETPEVQHAKAVFLNAHATASAQSRSYGHEDDGSYKPHYY